MMQPAPTQCPLQPRADGRGAIAFIAAPTVSAASKGRPIGTRLLMDAFRPFYLAGAILAAVAVPLWLGMWQHGYLIPSVPPLFWHGHEMVFGFGGAIIVGFLFTAARNWTGLPLPAGVPLGALCGLWFLARALIFFNYGLVAAAVDTALLAVVAAVLAQRFLRSGMHRNLPIVGVLLGLAACNASFHASLLDFLDISPLAAIEAGLMLVVLLVMIVGARVVPAFSASAVAGLDPFRAPLLQRAAIASAVAAFVADSLHPSSAIAGLASFAAALFTAAQWLCWKPWATRHRPMAWILQGSYGFIPVGLLLLGASAFGLLPRSAAIHAFSVGAMGGMIVGMAMRTSLGHTGREVRGGRAESAAFALVLAAAGLRLTASLAPSVQLPAMLAAGAAWSCAFLVFLVAYAPLLAGSARRGSRAGNPGPA